MGPSPAFGHVGELAEQLGVVCGIVAMGPRVAGREDPGRSVEGVHAEAGIVGNRHGQARLVQGGDGLDVGVVGEGLAVLHGIGEVSQLTEGYEAHVPHHGREDGLYLDDLVGVARRDDDGPRGVEGADVDGCHVLLLRML